MSRCKSCVAVQVSQSTDHWSSRFSTFTTTQQLFTIINTPALTLVNIHHWHCFLHCSLDGSHKTNFIWIWIFWLIKCNKINSFYVHFISQWISSLCRHHARRPDKMVISRGLCTASAALKLWRYFWIWNLLILRRDKEIQFTCRYHVPVLMGRGWLNTKTSGNNYSTENCHSF